MDSVEPPPAAQRWVLVVAGGLLLAVAGIGYGWVGSTYAEQSRQAFGVGPLFGIGIGLVVLVASLAALGGLASLTRSSWTWSVTGAVAGGTLAAAPLTTGDRIWPGPTGAWAALVLAVAALALIFLGRGRFPDGPGS